MSGARLAILSVRLGQFRSYAAGAIETGGAPVALHGPNGAGKTNLLEAASLLVPGRGLRRAEAAELARRAPGVAAGAASGGGWRVRAEIATPGGPVGIVTGQEPGEPGRRVEIDGKPAPQAGLGRLMRQVWLTPAMDRLWTDGAAERRRWLDRLTLGFDPDHAQVATDYEKAMRGRNRLLGEGRFDPLWLDGIEAQMARLGARMARARALAVAALETAQAGAQTLFPAADLAILGSMESAFAEAIRDGRDLDCLEAAEAAGLAGRLARGRGRDAAAGRTLDGPHRSDLAAVYAAKGMPAHACSTGEQKALLLSLCLSQARALCAATGAVPVLLLDEVAAHLDAARRRALYSELAALDAQAWMTGTGPELFDGLEGALLVAASDETGTTRLAPA